MTVKPFVDRRQFGRRQSTIHAIALVEGRPAAHCIVRNLSPKGAFLEFSEPFAPPYRFQLVIDTRNLDLLCEVKHQGNQTVGVSFHSGRTLRKVMRPDPQPMVVKAP